VSRVQALLTLILMLIGCGAVANSTEEELERLQSVPQPAARVLQVDADVRSSFDAALREYDQYLAGHRHDVTSHLRRCQFIDEFASTYEYSTFNDALGELSTKCRSEAQVRFPQHPEIILLQLEQSFGKERLRAAEQAVARSEQQSWTNGQMARLYTLMANTAEDLSDRRSGEFARQALAWDERSDVRVLLARKLAAEGRNSDVVAVLTSTLDGHDPSDGWYLTAKMQLLADAAAPAEVLRIYTRLREGQLQYDGLSAARVLRQVDAIREARWELDQLQSTAGQGQLAARERFRFELDFGTGAAALKAYHDWRAAGWQVDPLAINRVALLLHEPWLPWRLHDLLGLATLLLLLAGCAVLVCLPIALVHYRGLARRAVAAEVYPQSDWRLRDAWFALFSFVVPSILALYCAGPLDVLLTRPGWSIDADAKQLARIAIVESLLIVAMLLPLAQLAKRHPPRWWGAEWTLARCVAMGIATGLALRVPVFLALGFHDGKLSTSVQQPLWQLLTSVRAEYGALSALWLLVVFAPVIEEFVFRGVLLRAFAAHLRFGWANAVQAALFSAMHLDLRAAPSLFVLALSAGWLAQRSGGLLAPMALHAVFNLVVAIVMLRA
jgi:uncharacterized protein